MGAVKKYRKTETHKTVAKIAGYCHNLNNDTIFFDYPYLSVKFDVDGKEVEAKTDYIVSPRERDLPPFGSEIGIGWYQTKRGKYKCYVEDSRIETFLQKGARKHKDRRYISLGIVLVFIAVCCAVFT